MLVVGPLVLLVASVVLALLLAEIAVRAHIWSRPVSFHIVKSVFGQCETARFGSVFRRASARCSRSSRTAGGLVPGRRRERQRRRARRRSTLADARTADYVILTTGDSFTTGCAQR
jgi:hypothetical protein